ncbi:MAG: hypothetical protein ACO4BW_07475 [Nitriliruptoraceae bacterium]
MTTTTTIEVAAIAVAAGNAPVVTAPAQAGPPDPDVAPCGYAVEDHVTAPAYCGDVAELEARLDALHAERSAGRFAEVVR